MKYENLKDMRERISKNKKQLESLIESFLKRLESRDLQRGRVRPRDPVEQKILARFKRT